MAGTESTAIVELGPDDARPGLLLSTEAHWNQNEADWRFFLAEGTVFGVRDTGARSGRQRGAVALFVRAMPGSAWCW